MSVRPSVSAEREVLLANLILAHFVEVLADLHRDSGTHEPRFGHPPTSLVVDQREPSPNAAFNMGHALRRWRVTTHGAVEVPLVELPLPKRLPGMYYEEGRGDFSIGAHGATVRVGWHVGPRFGRGYDLPVTLEGSAARFGEPSPIWAS